MSDTPRIEFTEHKANLVNDLDLEDYGRYIIDVTMGERLVGTLSNRPGAIQFWFRRASKPGMDDELLYVHTLPTCHGLLRSEMTLLPICMHCGMPIMPDDLGESMYFNDTDEGVARRIARFIEGLNGDVDVRMYRTKVSLNDQALALDPRVDLRDKYAALASVRRDKECALYTKGRRERDLAVNSDLVSRLKDFLAA